MDGVAGWFVRRGETPLAPVPGLREHGPLIDDPDRASVGTCSDVGGLSFGVEYCDSRGWASARTIRCVGLDLNGPATLRAFCTMRQALRRFRVDRIIAIADYRTGAILSGEAHVALLAPYLRESGCAETAAMRALQDATRDGVHALLQVAMPSGCLPDASRAVILDYLTAEAAASQIALPAPERIALWIDNLSPPSDCVLAAVERLLAEKDKFARLLPWLLKVVRSEEAFDVQETSIRDLIVEVRGHYRRKLLDRPGQLRASA